MKKIFLCLVFAAMSLLVACGDDKESVSNEKKDKESKVDVYDNLNDNIEGLIIPGYVWSESKNLKEVKIETSEVTLPISVEELSKCNNYVSWDCSDDEKWSKILTDFSDYSDSTFDCKSEDNIEIKLTEKQKVGDEIVDVFTSLIVYNRKGSYEEALNNNDFRVGIHPVIGFGLDSSIVAIETRDDLLKMLKEIDNKFGAPTHIITKSTYFHMIYEFEDGSALAFQIDNYITSDGEERLITSDVEYGFVMNCYFYGAEYYKDFLSRIDEDQYLEVKTR